MIGYEQTIQSEYANSPTLRQMLANINTWLDQNNLVDSFYNNIWNVETAVGYGLDVWGRIVGITRVLQISSGTYFGFNNANDSSEVGWSQDGPWYSGQPATGNYALTDDAFRTLIYAKALYNIWDGSIPQLNVILITLFGDSGEAWVGDGLDMTMTYNFNFGLSPVQQAIMVSGAIPRPQGVSTSIVQG